MRKFKTELLSIHSSAGDQDNTCAKDEDCTDNVEDCSTDTTGGRKLSALFVLNSHKLINFYRIGCAVFISHFGCHSTLYLIGNITISIILKCEECITCRIPVLIGFIESERKLLVADLASTQLFGIRFLCRLTIRLIGIDEVMSFTRLDKTLADSNETIKMREY